MSPLFKAKPFTSALVLAGLLFAPRSFASRTVTYVSRPYESMLINISNPSTVTQTIDLELIGTGYELSDKLSSYTFEGSTCVKLAPDPILNSQMRSPVQYKCTNDASFKTLHPGYSISFRFGTPRAADKLFLTVSSGILIKITASSPKDAGFVIASGDNQQAGTTIVSFPINSGKPF